MRNQKARLQALTTRRCFSVSSEIIVELSTEYLKSGQFMNNLIYGNMLIKVRDTIRKKIGNEFRMEVALCHQDNIRPHVSRMTGWTLYKLEWHLMQHPTYRPDMAPSDLYLFSHLELHRDDTVLNSNGGHK